jgi:tetratricopeptide (TPR) repeat protein
VPKFIILFIVFTLTLCSCNSDQAVVTKNDELLKSLNSKGWDRHSQNNLSRLIKTPFAALTYTDKKLLIETLISHKQYQIAIALIDVLESKSQYLNYLHAYALIKNSDLQSGVATLLSTAMSKITVSSQNLLFATLADLGQNEKIIRLYGESKHQDDAISQYYLALSYLQQGDCKNAIDYFNRVLAIQPQANRVYASLALGYRMCGNEQQAEQSRSMQGDTPLENQGVYPNRLLKNGNPVLFYQQLLNDAWARNNQDEIIKLSELLIQLNASTSKLLYNYAITTYKSKQLYKANQALIRLLNDDINNTKALGLQFELNKSTDYQLALSAINKLLEIDSENSMYKNTKQQFIEYYKNRNTNKKP